MHSSQSSNSTSDNGDLKATSDSSQRNSYPVWKDAVTWVMRILVGGTFLFSGFAKGVDPWGTFYKFEDYLQAFGIAVPDNLVTVGAFLLCILEFLTGFFILFGCYRNAAPRISAVIMAVMLPLTLWIAISDPVADCGCFGDAFLISNWATFWKNVVLAAAVIWLLRHNSHATALISPAFQWLAFLSSTLFIFIVAWWGHQVQPLVDFRPYKIGSPIIAEENDAEEPEFIFIYEKDGVKKEFTDQDSIPSEDEGWKFVERKDIIPEKGSNQTGEFRIWTSDDDEDVTEEVILSAAPQLLVLIPSVEKVSASTTWKINALYDWAQAHDIDMIGIVASNSGNMTDWLDLSMPKYPVYISDDTSIKEVARGNPAIVYLEDGKVVWKSTLSALSDANFEEADTKSDIHHFMTEPESVLRNLCFIYICILAVLITISLIPRLGNMFIVKRRVNRDDTAPRSE